MRQARTVFFICLFASLAPAQTPTATLVGRIVDVTHAGVPGAAVQVRDVNTNETRTAQSAAGGDYTVSNLAPGMYEVTIDKPGFRRLRESNLELQVAQTARLDVQLDVGTVSETVEVRADVPLVNTENATRGDVATPNPLFYATHSHGERASKNQHH